MEPDRVGGCKDHGEDDTGDSASKCADEDIDLWLADDSNYSWTGIQWGQVDEFDQVTGRAEWDVTLSWAKLTRDIVGRALDPREVEAVVLLLFAGTVEELSGALAEGEIQQQDLEGSVAWENIDGATEVRLSELKFLENKVSLEEYHDGQVGLLTLSKSCGDSTIAWMGFIEFSVDSVDERVELADGVYSVEPGEVEFGREIVVELSPEMTVSWCMLGTDYQGGSLDPWGQSELRIVQYAGEEGDLRSSLAAGTMEPQQKWTQRVDGTTKSVLSDLHDQGGKAYSGTEEDGLWTLELWGGSSCQYRPSFLVEIP